MAFITVNGKKHELPKFTVAVAERNGEVCETKGVREKASIMYDFLSEMLGHDELALIVDGEDYESADIAAMRNLFTMVNNAYTDEMQEESTRSLKANVAEAKRLANELSDVMKSAERASSLAAANDGSRQVFASAI